MLRLKGGSVFFLMKKTAKRKTVSVSTAQRSIENKYSVQFDDLFKKAWEEDASEQAWQEDASKQPGSDVKAESEAINVVHEAETSNVIPEAENSFDQILLNESEKIREV
uniref:Uncharacterized protein n=1 Tax=Ananas comosus var. bracteatus TaxID=296719 RepID=A0A6V7Q2E2_ANACO|nr:unnamed protein product [Ananas comosus var. bracteatus]